LLWQFGRFNQLTQFFYAASDEEIINALLNWSSLLICWNIWQTHNPNDDAALNDR
jgi:hypothetical protein